LRDRDLHAAFCCLGDAVRHAMLEDDIRGPGIAGGCHRRVVVFALEPRCSGRTRIAGSGCALAGLSCSRPGARRQRVRSTGCLFASAGRGDCSNPKTRSRGNTPRSSGPTCW
jgi:hypothetical protein